MPENIIATEFSDIMQQSYINYSMSVITSRAVPDVRDGLKPVQRRVLYAMNELKLNADGPHRKSARIVGDAMGKYHPHGDSSIYDALVVLSQDFKKGMALVDGHGNFGSIEGDGAAAMRYTEAKLRKFTQEVYLADLDKDVVDFVPNFDETEKEPAVLPVRIPNFLVNGSEGIAVGMTTSTPPHNLAEVLNAMKHLIDHPAASTLELMDFVKGPDFPTGGIVTNKSDLIDIYESGKGKIKIRGKAVVEKGKRKIDKDKIVITEIPYTMIGANIGKFLSEVARLVESKQMPDILDISNQSSKEGIKIVLELKKGADGEKILQGLYKKTKLEDTFGVNMLCILDGKPEVLGLKSVLRESIAFQVELNTRKYTNLLAKEVDKKEIQEGLITAIDVIDLIIEVIRGSRDIKMAKACLTKGTTEGINFKSKTGKSQASKLHFTDRQASAILELNLGRLIGLEILSLQAAYKDTVSKITKYEKILNNKKTMLSTIKADLDDIAKKYALNRRTKIKDVEEAVFEAAPIKEVQIVFAMNRFGYVKTMDEAVYQKNEEAILLDNKTVFRCMNTSRIGVFTKNGLLHQVKLLDLPLCKPKDKGIPLDNVCNYDSSIDDIVSICDMSELEKKTFVFVTASGLAKRVPATEFDVVKKSVASTKLAKDDYVVSVELEEKKHIIVISDSRTYTRYLVSDLPLQKKMSIGVKGIKLKTGQLVKAVYYANPHEYVFVDVDGYSLDLTEVKPRKREGAPAKF